MIRVLICDDQEVVCEGLRAILSTVAEIEVVGVAHTGAEALTLAAQVQPEVVLMDLKMPGLNGIQATQHLRSYFPQIHVLILTTYDADEWVFDAIRAGASGYLLKDTPREGLISAIKTTALGATAVDPNIAGKLFNYIAQSAPTTPPLAISTSAPPPQAAHIDDLSEREQEMLRLVAKGLSNAQIAQQLHLSEGTVRNYMSTIFIKLGVADRTQATLVGLRLGIITLYDV